MSYYGHCHSLFCKFFYNIKNFFYHLWVKGTCWFIK